MSSVKAGISLGTLHKVTSTKVNTSFDPQGKNGLLILTSDAMCGIGLTASPVDAANRAVTYATFEDLAAAWDPSCPAYQAAQTASQNGNPTEFAVAFYDDAENITAALNEIRDCYSNFFVFTTPNLKDDPRQLDVAAWAAGFSPQHVYSALTCDPLTLDTNDTTSIASQIKAMNFTTLVNYQDAANTGFLDAAVAGYVGSQNFDTTTNYTAFGQQFSGVAPSPVNDTEFGVIQDKCANAYVCVQPSNIEHYDAGRLADGSFIDSCHKLCWLNVQLQEAQLSTQLEDGPPRNSREGYQDYLDRYEEPLALAVQRGVIASYEITAPQFDELTRSQIASREPVCVTATITDIGSIHGSCITNEFTL